MIRKRTLADKSVYQLAKEKKKPISPDKIETMYRITSTGDILLDDTGKPVTYQYVAPENVIDMTQEEYDAYWSQKEKEKQERAELRKKKSTSIAGKRIHQNKQTKKSVLPIPTEDYEGKRIICFDTETTGVDPNKDELLQVTIFDGNGKEIYSSLVKPQYHASWYQAQLVNHISPKDVRYSPSARDIANEVNRIFQEADVIVGHNVRFDMDMISAGCGTKFDGKVIHDTLKIFRTQYPKGSHKLRDAIIAYCPEELRAYDKNAHKADTDAKATLAVFRAQIEKEKNKENNKSRIVAGYCWEWPKDNRNNPNYNDIIIPEYNFEISWNLDGKELFALGENTVKQAGCIHTTQGLEFDYVGVIIGKDMRYENGNVVTDFTKRAKSDSSLKGIKKMYKENPEKALKLSDEIIKNTYRTLMTRGMKGCYVYCEDKPLAEYLKSRINKGNGITYAIDEEEHYKSLSVAEDDEEYRYE